jgi:regulator of cell morphogenesis and NO signaling
MPPDAPETWTLTRLADHLTAADHRRLRELAPRAAAYARRIRDVHGTQHPELEQVAAASDGLAAALEAHWRREEDVLFPALRRTEQAVRHGTRVDPEDVSAIASSLHTLRAEHEELLAILDRLRALTMDYALPYDACASYDLAYRTLTELDATLRRHLATADCVLLPKAQALRDRAGRPA